MSPALRTLSKSLAAVFLLAVPALRAGDWNSTLGGRSDRTGLSPEVGPRGPDLLWQGSTDAQLPQFPVTEGRRVFSTRIEVFDDPEHSAYVVAQDLFTGAMLWKKQVPISFGDSWSTQALGVRDGQLYASRASNGSNREYLYALSVLDGSILWVSEDLVDQADSVQGVAFLANGDLIQGNFASLVRIDHTNGKTLWRSPRLCPIGGGCAAAVAGDRTYSWDVIGSSIVISRFDAATGAKLYSSGALSWSQTVPMVGPDFTVYAPMADNTPNDAFVALADTGSAFQEKWRVPMAWVPFGSFGISPDGSVYTYSRANEVIRLEPATGQIRNTSFPIPTDAAAFQPRLAVDAYGKVYLSNGAVGLGALYSFNPDLTLRWSLPINTLAGPALGQDGTLVVAGVGTNFRVFRSPATSFYTITPCRLVDTRNPPGPNGGPALADSASRTFLLAGACAIPADAAAVALNVAVTEATSGPGFLTFHPAGAALPVLSSLDYTAGRTRANNAIVPLGALGDLTIYCQQGGGTAHAVIDATGYFK